MSAAPQSFRTAWRGVGLSLQWKPEYFATDDGCYAVAHLEIHTYGRAPLPITETGYKSHFVQRAMVESEGGPVAYVLAWLDHAAKSPAWKASEAAARQLSLF